MIDRLVFLDIETASGHKTIQALALTSAGLADAWYKKAVRKYSAEYTNSEHNANDFASISYIDKAAIYPEYGRVVAATMGVISVTGGESDESLINYKKNVKTFYNTDEKVLLQDIANALTKLVSNKPDAILSGFNIRKFDMPYLCKRMVINGVTIPSIIDVTGKKPYEVNIVDLMERWMYGSSEWVSLEVVALSLGLPSPKAKMNGGEVSDVFYDESLTEDEKKAIISEYCATDVLIEMDVAMILV
jgi:3'-5' exonuclease